MTNAEPQAPGSSETIAVEGLTFLSRVATGFFAPWKGLAFLGRHSNLWRYAVAPIILNILITGVILTGLVAATTAYALHIHPRFPDGWLGWLYEAGAILGLLALVVGLVACSWVFCQAAFCGYFYGRLTRRVEMRLGTAEEELKDLTFRQELTDGVIQTLKLVAVNLGLFCLNIIPGIGSFVAVAGGIYFGSFSLGREFLQFPSAIRGLGREAQDAFARQHRPATLGLGAAALLLSFIPFVNSVFLTTAAVGAVLLRRKLNGETTEAPVTAQTSIVPTGNVS